MTPRPMLFYDVREVCQAWCDELLRHGNVQGACQKVGVGVQHFYQVKRGAVHLPRKIVEALGLLPVKALHTAELLGYLAATPLDLSRLWEDTTP